MNTIRQEIKKTTDRNEVALSFEGENGKFNICLSKFSVLGGSSRVNIQLDPEDAGILQKSLENFLS